MQPAELKKKPEQPSVKSRRGGVSLCFLHPLLCHMGPPFLPGGPRACHPGAQLVPPVTLLDPWQRRGCRAAPVPAGRVSSLGNRADRLGHLPPPCLSAPSASACQRLLWRRSKARLGWRKFLQEVWTAERLGVSLAARRYLGLRLAGLRMGGAALLPSAASLAGAAAGPSALGGAGRRLAVPLLLILARLKLLPSGCSLWTNSRWWRCSGGAFLFPPPPS